MDPSQLSPAALERRHQFEEYLHDGHLTAEDFRRLALHQYDEIERLKGLLDQAGIPHAQHHSTVTA